MFSIRFFRSVVISTVIFVVGVIAIFVAAAANRLDRAAFWIAWSIGFLLNSAAEFIILAAFTKKKIPIPFLVRVNKFVMLLHLILLVYGSAFCFFKIDSVLAAILIAVVILIFAALGLYYYAIELKQAMRSLNSDKVATKIGPTYRRR